MIIGANHTSFTVSDMEKSLAFFGDLLGMKIVSDREVEVEFAQKMTGFPGVHLRIVYLKITENTEHMIELIQYFDGPGKPGNLRTCDAGCPHMALYTDNIANGYERLTAAGIKFRSGPLEVGGGPNKGNQVCYFTGPDGIMFELIEEKKKR
ncbi:MAG: VOC family protein [bacterium]